MSRLRRSLFLVLPALVITLSCGNGQTLVSIALSPSAVDATGIGARVQFTAMGTFQRPHETRDITKQVTWSSASTQVATVDSNGLAVSTNLCGSTPITAAAHSDLNAGTGSLITGQAQFIIHNPGDPNCPFK